MADTDMYVLKYLMDMSTYEEIVTNMDPDTCQQDMSISMSILLPSDLFGRVSHLSLTTHTDRRINIYAFNPLTYICTYS